MWLPIQFVRDYRTGGLSLTVGRFEWELNIASVVALQRAAVRTVVLNNGHSVSHVIPLQIPPVQRSVEPQSPVDETQPIDPDVMASIMMRVELLNGVYVYTSLSDMSEAVY